MPIQFVQVDKGGDIYEDVVDIAPARWEADPAPTVTIMSRTGDELVASQAATLGPSTTLAAAATADSSSATLAAVTSINVGDTLCLGPNSGGQWEWVTVDSVTSATKIIQLRDDLRYTYAVGDAIKSHRLSVTLTGAEADAIYENARAQWAYEIATNQARTDTTIFHISKWVPKMTLRDQDVLVRQPRAIDLLGTRQRLEQLIEDVWKRDILEDLGQMFNPGGLLSGDVLRQAHMYRVLAEVEIMSGDQEGQEQYLRLYQSSWERVMQQVVADVDGDGQIDDDDIVRSTMTGRVYRVQ